MTLSSQSSRSSSLKSVLPAPSLSWKTAATMKTNSRTLSCKTLCSRVRGPPPCKTHKFRLILRDAGVIRAMRRSTLKSAFGKAAATQLLEKPLPSSRPPSAKSSPTKTSSKTSTSNPSTCHFSPRITIQAHNKKAINKMTLETLKIRRHPLRNIMLRHLSQPNPTQWRTSYSISRKRSWTWSKS